MKIATLHVDGNTIETRNNMLTGVETVYFNGRKVSSQFNWFVGIHHFSVPAADGYGSDDYRVEFRFSWTTFGITTNIYRNGECLLDMEGTTFRYDAARGTALPTVNDNRPADGYWTGSKERVSRPLYRDEDLV